MTHVNGELSAVHHNDSVLRSDLCRTNARQGRFCLWYYLSTRKAAFRNYKPNNGTVQSLSALIINVVFETTSLRETPKTKMSAIVI